MLSKTFVTFAVLGNLAGGVMAPSPVCLLNFFVAGIILGFAAAERLQTRVG